MPNNVERTIPFEEVDDMSEEALKHIRHRLIRRPGTRDYTLLTESGGDKLKEVRAVLPEVVKVALPGGVVIDEEVGDVVRVTDVTGKGRVYLQIGLVIE